MSQVHKKLKTLVPQEDGDPLDQAGTGGGINAIKAQDKALIMEYLANLDIKNSRKSKGVELDMNAQIAGMRAGSKLELHAGITRGGEEILALSTNA